jgi:hypothetical protein
MASQDWHTPEIAAQAAGIVPVPTVAAYELRPLSLGEILDRTFSIYRSRFWLFAGISAMSGSIQLIVEALGLLIHHIVLVRYGLGSALLATELVNGLASLLFILATSVTQAATVFALGEVYLGRQTTVISSLKATIRRWYRYLGVALWQSWSMVWVALLAATPAIYIFVMRLASLYWLGALFALAAGFGGLGYGIYAYLRNSLGVQICVVEETTVRQSMRRSKFLSQGTLGRIFLVLLIAAALLWVAGMLQAPFLFFILRTPKEEHVLAQGATLLITFFTHTVVSPVAMIGLSLVYFDQRVRKEAFDLMMLLGQEEAPPQAVTPDPAYPAVAYSEAEVAYPQTISPAMSTTEHIAPAAPATTVSEEDAGKTGDATSL